MRYETLINKAKKHKRGFELVLKECEEINNECDKYSDYITKTDTMALLRTVTKKIVNDILSEIKNIPPAQRHVAFEMQRFYAPPVYNEILREKMRKNNTGSSNKPDKMIAAYKRLAYFVSEILEPLAANDPCEIIMENGRVRLQYEESFAKMNERTNKLIGMQNNYLLTKYEPSQAVVEEYMKRPDTNLDFDIETRFHTQIRKAPWIFIDEENSEAYNKENHHLLKVHAILDSYCSRLYLEPLFQYICNNKELCMEQVHREIRNAAAIRSNEKYIQWLLISNSKFDIDNAIDEYLEKEPLGAVAAKTFPIVVRTKESFYGLEYFTDEDRAVIPKLIIDMDAELDEENINKLDICNRPVIKCNVDGQELYIYIPIIFSQLQYADTAYKNIDKNTNAISKYMEQLITSQFTAKDGLIDANANLGKDKQIRLFPPKSEGDFDCFIIDQKHKCAIIIEYKHSTYFRRNAYDARNFANNHENKAKKQIRNLLNLIKTHPRELEKYMELPDGILSELDIYPLIISSSIEYDGEYQLVEPIELNWKTIETVKKISFFEFNLALNEEFQIKNALIQGREHEIRQYLSDLSGERTLPRIIEIIDSGEVLKMLELNQRIVDSIFAV